MKKIHIISHTHWDREWYRSFEFFRSKLVFVLDKAISLLENNSSYKHFMLDGQTIPLEDYLEIKPENEDRLAKLVKSGKLSVGPWYILPDEFAPDGESLIRNLLLGISISNKFGEPMMIGYLPDSFGHSGQMPHILKGFGIDSAVVMRGVPEDAIHSSEFGWEAVNGDKVLTIYLPHGYSNALFMPDQFGKFKLRMATAIRQMEKWTSTDNYLLLNGVDHQFPQEHIGEFIERLNSNDKKAEYLHGTLDGYIASVKDNKNNLDVVKGELISPDAHRVHTSIASTRIYQKYQNRRLEALLEKYVEPVSTIAWLFKADYPKGLIRKTWKYLIQNQTHDGLCGCCTDEVHREMDQRFTSARTIGRTLVNGYSRAIAKRISADQLTLTVFNNAMTLGKQLVHATVYVKKENFSLTDLQGEIIPYQILKSEEVDVSTLSIWTLYIGSAQVLKKMDICFYLNFDSNIGYQVLKINEKKKYREEESEITVKKNFIENKYFAIVVCENGSLNIFDKLSSRQYHNLHIFKDCGDAGDTYNYSPVKNDTVITSENSLADYEIVQHGKNQATVKITLDMHVPSCLAKGDQGRSEELTALPITTYLTIYSDIRRIDFKTEIDNTVEDHRLRVLFQTGIESNHSYAETQFGTVIHENDRNDAGWKRKGWKENPLPIYSQHRFVELNDGERGFTVLNRGLPEYEIYNNSIIALTLVRSVGYMGKKNLLIRPGRYSGISVPTPDAQCAGKQILEYAIIPHEGNIDEGMAPKSAAQFDAPALAIQNKLWRKRIFSKDNIASNFLLIENLTSHIHDQLEDKKLADHEIFTIHNENLLISAFKQAEEGDFLVIRLYNSSSVPVEKSLLEFGMDIQEGYLTDFSEVITQSLEQTGKRSFILPIVKAYSAVTLKFKV